MGESKLNRPLPCRCGNEEVVIGHYPDRDRYYVICWKCGARGSEGSTHEMAVEYWNTYIYSPRYELKCLLVDNLEKVN